MAPVWWINTYFPLQATATDLTALPDNFFVGAATAAYQIEGAWNVSGKFTAHTLIHYNVILYVLPILYTLEHIHLSPYKHGIIIFAGLGVNVGRKIL